MSRDQRSKDNWALLYACEVAQRSGSGVVVAFNLVHLLHTACGCNMHIGKFHLSECSFMPALAQSAFMTCAQSHTVKQDLPCRIVNLTPSCTTRLLVCQSPHAISDRCHMHEQPCACSISGTTHKVASTSTAQVTEFLGAGARQWGFLVRGLRQVEPKLRELNIPFYMMYGKAEDNLPKLVEDLGAGLLICDFVPVRAAREWREKVCSLLMFMQSLLCLCVHLHTWTLGRLCFRFAAHD